MENIYFSNAACKGITFKLITTKFENSIILFDCNILNFINWKKISQHNKIFWSSRGAGVLCGFFCRAAKLLHHHMLEHMLKSVHTITEWSSNVNVLIKNFKDDSIVPTIALQVSYASLNIYSRLCWLLLFNLLFSLVCFCAVGMLVSFVRGTSIQLAQKRGASLQNLILG